MTDKKETVKTARDDASPQPPLPTGVDLLDDSDTDSGSIQISENVIAAVVRKYTLEIKGVVRFATSSIVGGLAEMIGKRNYESSIAVGIDNDVVSISVTLVLEFGVRIPEVAGQVQDIIRARVEELTGKQVSRVNVLVQDLEERVRGEGDDDETFAEANEEK